jgi:AAA+ superfamily predicted ATPase
MSCNKNFLSLFLLVVSTVAFSMDQQQYRRPIPIKPLHIPNSGQSSSSSTSSTSSTSTTPSASSSATADAGVQGLLNANSNEAFDQEDIAEMNLVFNSSPPEAQIIVDHLKDPTYLNDREYRSAIFAGEPGTGKSMMAQAIGYKMMIEAGWQYKFLASTQFMEKFRNQTAIRLTQVLQAIKACVKPTILIIDELNRLLEHAESQHHDTDATSAALWTFIDQMRKNDKFFFIGTMNRLTKLPKPYKSRILLEYIKFPALTEPGQKIAIIRSRLTDAITQIDPAVTDDALKDELQQVKDCSQRDLKKLASFARRLYRTQEKKETPSIRTPHMLIDLALVKAAVASCKARKGEVEYDVPEETDAERQERHHKATMARQEKHFLQQQIKQDLLSQYSRTVSDSYEQECIGGTISFPSTVQIVNPEGVRRIQELFSPEQQAIVTTLKAQTTERLAREAQEKARREEAAEAQRRNYGPYRIGSFVTSLFSSDTNTKAQDNAQ